jgi:autophagy-related protein 9
MGAEVIMQRIAEHTHCFPEEWRGKAHTHAVRDAFARAFRYKAWLFFDEVTSVVFAPLVLCFSLPSSAPTILEFIRENTVDVDGLGSVLGHSLFDFDTYGDAKYGSPINGTKPTERGKMEKSFLNFTLNYPEWAASDERSARFLKNVKHCASTQQGVLSPEKDEEAEKLVIKNSRYQTDRLLGLSFERLDQYAAFKHAARRQ